MKRMKRLTALLLVLLMLVTLAPAVFAVSQFSDVTIYDWFYHSVNWAVDKGITTGVGNGLFGPNNDCTRAQVVTFLWAKAGRPEPQSTNIPFMDVYKDDWFCKPVLWAVENGITGGTSEFAFSPNAVCTRAQVATFLWAEAGKPAPGVAATGFIDVSSGDWFYNPVMWAVAEGITSGIGNGKFGPNNNCTRAQIATFMYAASDDYVKPEPTPVPTPTPVPKPTPAPLAPEDRFEIAAAYVDDINSVDGVDVKLYWRNNTGRDLADIIFYVSVLDYNGNLLTCDISHASEFGLFLKNPPFPSGEGDLYFSGMETYSGKTEPQFTDLRYDEEIDEYFYYGPYEYHDTPYRYLYVSPTNQTHQYRSTYKEAIMYNGRAQQLRVNRVVLTYPDNTQETIYNPKVGLRTSPEMDKEYTETVLQRLGCDVVGHDAKPTCTQGDTCKRCLKVLPALGHDYDYGGKCKICYEQFSDDLHFVNDIAAPISDIDANGNPFTFEITGARLNERYNSTVVLDDNKRPYINFYVDVDYAYNGGGRELSPDIYTVFVAVWDEEGNCIANASFDANPEKSTRIVNLSVDKSGTYRLEVSAVKLPPE